MIKCHREYEEAASEFAINMYFWGFHGEHTDISDIDDIEETFQERLADIRVELQILGEWVESRKPVLVRSNKRAVTTSPRGALYSVQSPALTYTEQRPAGIFDQDEIQPVTNTPRNDGTRLITKIFLRVFLNSQLRDFANDCNS